MGNTPESAEQTAKAPRRRIWVQHVAVETDKLQMRVDAARARTELSASQEVVAAGVTEFLRKARAAAFRDDPIPGRLANWWRGTLVEAAYRNLHTARAQMIDLYDPNELRAEIPMVVARANETIHRDDPRRITVAELEAESLDSLPPRMRRVIGDSYEQLDLQHAQLRSFRNIVLLAALFIVLLVGGTLVVVGRRPDVMPLCFPNEVMSGTEPVVTTVKGLNCPTSSGLTAMPTTSDILVVALLGALGGALAATLAIRHLRGTSTPYDVPVALAFLKVPMGALTAILALVAIQGDFVPGLSVLDSQGQILAYALVFGFSQQALSRLLDKRAQTLLEGLPGGTTTAPTPPGSTKLAPQTAEPPVGGTPGPVPEAPPPEVPPPAGAEPAPDVAADVGVEAAPDDATGDARPVAEPDGASQRDQYDQLRETGNERRDMSEQEEAGLLQAEFGPPDPSGIYGAPPAEEQ